MWRYYYQSIHKKSRFRSLLSPIALDSFLNSTSTFITTPFLRLGYKLPGTIKESPKGVFRESAMDCRLVTLCSFGT